MELSDSFESVVEVEVAGSFVLGPVGSFVWEPAMQVCSFRSRVHTKYIHDNKADTYRVRFFDASINLLVDNLVLQHFHSFHLEHYRKSVVVLDCTVVEALFDTVGVVLADTAVVQPT